MKKIIKILLTIPSVLSLSYILIFLFPIEFKWLVPSMDAYYIEIGSIKFLSIIQLVVLIRKLWSFKYLEKSKKSDWTWILIIFNSISSLIFIWKRVDDFEKINKTIEAKNTY